MQKQLIENQLNNFFNYYPLEFIEESVESVFQSILPYSIDSLNYMSLFYEELNLMIKNCASLYTQHRHKFVSTLASRNLQNLDAIVCFLKEVIPTGYIFCTTANSSRIDLLIIMDKYKYKSFDEMRSLLDFAMLGHQNINCTVHAYGTIYDMLLKGHLYYSAVCVPENCVYQSEVEFSLPSINKQQYLSIFLQSKAIFKQNISKSLSFFKGTKQFLNSDENTMAAFMLQQACELTFRSLLLSLRGKEIKCHDLIVLRKHLSHFDPSIIGMFDKDEQKELNILTAIQQAYIKARYDQNYEINTSELIRLINAAEKFIQSAQKIFDDYCAKLVLNLN
jgi:HEPN domain-containing protein